LLVLKGNVFIHPCAQGFFIAEFDLQEDKDLIFSSIPWLWGCSSLCMMPWYPFFLSFRGFLIFGTCLV
jgi:hypothetical protein